MEQKIVRIQTEFHEHKKNTNKRLDEILEKLKPQFTQAQVTTFLLSLVLAMSGAMVYITDVKSDTRVNTLTSSNNKDKIKVVEETQRLRYNNIDVKLDQLIKDVAVLNATKQIKQ